MPILQLLGTTALEMADDWKAAASTPLFSVPLGSSQTDNSLKQRSDRNMNPCYGCRKMHKRVRSFA